MKIQDFAGREPFTLPLYAKKHHKNISCDEWLTKASIFYRFCKNINLLDLILRLKYYVATTIHLTITFTWLKLHILRSLRFFKYHFLSKKKTSLDHKRVKNNARPFTWHAVKRTSHSLMHGENANVVGNPTTSQCEVLCLKEGAPSCCTFYGSLKNNSWNASWRQSTRRISL